MKATAKDLRFYSKELLEAVSRGEEVIITFRGKPYAKLVPLEDQHKSESSTMELFGLWKNRDDIGEVDKYVRQLRRERF